MYYDTMVAEDVDMFFKEYATAKKKTLKDLRGKIQFSEGYDYKSMRV